MKKKNWRRVFLACSVAGAVMGGLEAYPALAAVPAAEQQAVQGIERVTVLADVYGDGAQAAGAALLYPKVMDAAKLSVDDFAVKGKAITGVYTNDKPEMTGKSVPGKYVILTFAHVSSVPAEREKKPGEKRAGEDEAKKRGGDAPMYSDRKAPDLSLSVVQTGAVQSADGTVFETLSAVASTDVVNPAVAGFTQHVFTDPITGESITYDLFLPAGYDANDTGKTYPLVFFTADASANNGVPQMALLQGNGATVFASPAEQKKHPAIVVAPEYTNELIAKIGMLTDDTNTWTKGLTLVSNMLFDIIDKYNVDTMRIYGTGQSQGGMTNIALSDKYPNLFAAQYLVACQWNTEEMAAMKDKNLWITVCEGDTKAHPGMDAATALWKSLGSSVEENETYWDSTLPPETLSGMAKELAAKGAKINYTVFAGGSHNYTWTFAYNIEYIRDWLFSHVNDSPDRGPAAFHPDASTLRPGR